MVASTRVTQRFRKLCAVWTARLISAKDLLGWRGPAMVATAASPLAFLGGHLSDFSCSAQVTANAIRTPVLIERADEVYLAVNKINKKIVKRTHVPNAGDGHAGAKSSGYLIINNLVRIARARCKCRRDGQQIGNDGQVVDVCSLALGSRQHLWLSTGMTRRGGMRPRRHSQDTGRTVKYRLYSCTSTINGTGLPGGPRRVHRGLL